jgi:hypothetical protein
VFFVDLVILFGDDDSVLMRNRILEKFVRVLDSCVLDEIHQVHVNLDGLICFWWRERKRKCL